MKFVLSFTGIVALLACTSFGAAGDIACFETQATNGSSLAVACSSRALLYTSQLAGDPEQPATKQAGSLMARMKALLRESGHAKAQPLRLEWVVVKDADVAAIHRVMRKEFPGKFKPAVSLVQGSLSRPGVSYALNGIHALPATTKPVGAGIIRIGQDSVATLPAGGTTYVSGQAEQGTNTAESAMLTLGSLMRTLDFLKLTRHDVVQFKVFLQPITDTAPVMAALEKIYGGEHAVPPVVFVEWLGKPSLEIELVAASPIQAGAESLEYLTPPGMSASPVYCRAVRVNSPVRVFVSTLTASHEANAEVQTERVFAQLSKVLAATGSSFQHLAKATYYVTDDGASKALNQLRPRYYDPKRPPAASKALVTGSAVPGRTLALDMIAVPAR